MDRFVSEAHCQALENQGTARPGAPAISALAPAPAPKGAPQVAATAAHDAVRVHALWGVTGVELADWTNFHCYITWSSPVERFASLCANNMGIGQEQITVWKGEAEILCFSYLIGP